MRNKLALFIREFIFLKKIIYQLGRKRIEYYLPRILQFISRKSKILEVGSGTCNIVELLSKRGHKVTGLDICDLSFVDSITPIVYDGKKMPFKNNEFNIAIIFTVLHHIKDPEVVIKEASRVAKYLIIGEELYTNSINKYLLFFWDSLTNFEFIGHPHSNKTDKEWRDIFKKNNLELMGVKYNQDFKFVKFATYFLKAN